MKSSYLPPLYFVNPTSITSAWAGKPDSKKGGLKASFFYFVFSPQLNQHAPARQVFYGAMKT